MSEEKVESRFDKQKRIILEQQAKQAEKKAKSGSSSGALSNRSFRMSDDEHGALEEWVTELDSLSGGKGRKINTAMLIRGLIAMREDIDNNKLLESIRNTT